MVLGLILNLWFKPNHWFFAIIGITAGFVILLIPFALRWLGAGDVKLLMVFGSFLGWQAVWKITLFSAIAGGIISAIYILKLHGRSVGLLRITLVFTALWNREHRLPIRNLSFENKLYIPYGIALFIGLLVFLWHSAHY